MTARHQVLRGLHILLDAGGGAHALRSRRGDGYGTCVSDLRGGGWPLRFSKILAYVSEKIPDNVGGVCPRSSSGLRGRRPPGCPVPGGEAPAHTLRLADLSNVRGDRATNASAIRLVRAVIGRTGELVPPPNRTTNGCGLHLATSLSHRATARRRGLTHVVIRVCLCSARAMALPPARDSSTVFAHLPCRSVLAGSQLVVTLVVSMARSPGSLTATPMRSSRRPFGDDRCSRRVGTLRSSVPALRSRAPARDARRLEPGSCWLTPAPDATKAVVGVRAPVGAWPWSCTAPRVRHGRSPPAGPCVNAPISRSAARLARARRTACGDGRRTVRAHASAHPTASSPYFCPRNPARVYPLDDGDDQTTDHDDGRVGVWTREQARGSSFLPSDLAYANLPSLSPHARQSLPGPPAWDARLALPDVLPSHGLVPGSRRVGHLPVGTRAARRGLSMPPTRCSVRVHASTHPASRCLSTPSTLCPWQTVLAGCRPRWIASRRCAGVPTPAGSLDPMPVHVCAAHPLGNGMPRSRLGKRSRYRARSAPELRLHGALAPAARPLGFGRRHERGRGWSGYRPRGAEVEIHADAREGSVSPPAGRSCVCSSRVLCSSPAHAAASFRRGW